MPRFVIRSRVRLVWGESCVETLQGENPKQEERIAISRLSISFTNFAGVMPAGEDDYEQKPKRKRMAIQLFEQGRYAESLALYERLLERPIRNPQWHLPVVQGVADCLRAQSKYAQEEPFRLECLRICDQISDTKVWEASQLVILEQLGRCLLSQGKFELAEPVCLEGLQMSIVKFGRGNEATFIRVRDLVYCLYALGKNEEADEWYDVLIQTGESLPPGAMPHQTIIRLLKDLAAYFSAQGAMVQANSFSAKALADGLRLS